MSFFDSGDDACGGGARGGVSPSRAALTKAFPGAPAPELVRFAAAREDPAEALALYENYRAWRAGAGSADELAAAAAPVDSDGRDRFVQFGGTQGVDRVVLVEGARYDVDVDVDAYVAFVCRKLDGVVSSDDARRLLVLVDCRPQEGWRNPAVYGHVPLIRALSNVVPDMYPERLARVVVYPLPSWATFVLGSITALLSEATAQKIVFLAGDDALGAPCPAELRDYVDAAALPADARARHAALDRDA